MTNRRWMVDENDQGPGPLETWVVRELEGLGYTPLTPAGALRTAAERAQLLAETYDHSQNAAALPGLDRQLAACMDEARRAAKPAEGGLTDPGDAEEEVDDFTRRRRDRGTGTDN